MPDADHKITSCKVREGGTIHVSSFSETGAMIIAAGEGLAAITLHLRNRHEVRTFLTSLEEHAARLEACAPDDAIKSVEDAA